VRSDDSLNELSKTDDYMYQLTKCFHSCWIKSHRLQILKQDKTVTVKIVSLHCNIPPDQTVKTFS
jgi:hypothetical protein